jgi:hypothetical protein
MQGHFFFFSRDVSERIAREDRELARRSEGVSGDYYYYAGSAPVAGRTTTIEGGKSRDDDDDDDDDDDGTESDNHRQRDIPRDDVRG